MAERVDWSRVAFLLMEARESGGNTVESILGMEIAPAVDRVVERVVSQQGLRVVQDGIARTYHATPAQEYALREGIMDAVRFASSAYRGEEPRAFISKVTWLAIDARLSDRPLDTGIAAHLKACDGERERYARHLQALEESREPDDKARTAAAYKARKTLADLIAGRERALGEHLGKVWGEHASATTLVRQVTGTLLGGAAAGVRTTAIASQGAYIEQKINDILTALDAPAETYAALEGTMRVFLPGISLAKNPSVPVAALGPAGTPVRVEPRLKKGGNRWKDYPEQTAAIMGEYERRLRALEIRKVDFATHVARELGVVESTAYTLVSSIGGGLASIERGGHKAAWFVKSTVDILGAAGALTPDVRDRLERIVGTLPTPRIRPYVP